VGDDARVSDETLIGRMAAGDSAAFDRLVGRHQAAVYRFARAAAAAGDAEEILRETFEAARRSAWRYRDETSARPWLLALARQAIGRRNPPPPAREASLRELAWAVGWGGGSHAWTEGPVTAAFESLPAEDREILTVCDREYFTTDEAARVTGLSDAAVRTRLHRARLRLLARLKEDGRGE
jgi:RNA polymerase sigma-70 factor (ECF subfamily)